VNVPLKYTSTNGDPRLHAMHRGTRPRLHRGLVARMAVGGVIVSALAFQVDSGGARSLSLYLLDRLVTDAEAGNLGEAVANGLNPGRPPRRDEGEGRAGEHPGGYDYRHATIRHPSTPPDSVAGAECRVARAYVARCWVTAIARLHAAAGEAEPSLRLYLLPRFVADDAAARYRLPLQ
jgi:hypothetical protein